MIELTAEDWSTLSRLTCGDDDVIPSDEDTAIYRAGLSAGIERAAAALDSTNPQLRPSGCAIVIRALNATQPKEK